MRVSKPPRAGPLFFRGPLSHPGLQPDTLSHSKSITEVIRVLQEPVPPNSIVLLNASDAYEFHNDYSDLSADFFSIPSASSGEDLVDFKQLIV